MSFCYQRYFDIHPPGSYHHVKSEMFLDFPDLYTLQVIFKAFCFSEITNSLTAPLIFTKQML